MSRHPAGGQHYHEGPEYDDRRGIRILVVVDWNPAEDDCTIESLSTHRSCSHRLGCASDEGGPTGALRALADAIDAAEDRWRGIPD